MLSTLQPFVEVKVYFKFAYLVCNFVSKYGTLFLPYSIVLETINSHMSLSMDLHWRYIYIEKYMYFNLKQPFSWTPPLCLKRIY